MGLLLLSAYWEAADCGSGHGVLGILQRSQSCELPTGTKAWPCRLEVDRKKERLRISANSLFSIIRISPTKCKFRRQNVYFGDKMYISWG